MSQFEDIAGLLPKDYHPQDVGISHRAVSLGRMVDRLPVGRHVIIASINADKTWNIQIIGEETWHKITAILE